MIFSRHLWTLYGADAEYSKVIQSGSLTPGQTLLRLNLTRTYKFYGRNVSNVTISRRGYIITGEEDPQNQYIAPLRAEFRNGNVTFREYKTQGVHHLSVVWKEVESNVGDFTFLCVFQSTGEIVFLYRKIPEDPFYISEKVNIGLSDAVKVPGSRASAVLHPLDMIEYDVEDTIIGGEAAILWKPIKSCEERSSNCTDCIEGDDCLWCHAANLVRYSSP